MHTTSEATEPEPTGRGRAIWWVLGIVGVVIIGTALVIANSIIGSVRSIPQFPSLAESPDPTLRGTVAYFSDPTGCVRIVAAAGQPSKDVLCLPERDIAKAQQLGKELGPQLVWLPNGRLQITMFRMTDPPGPGFNPGWQKTVDVRTGKVTETPTAEVPTTPNLRTRPLVSPSGQEIQTTSEDGHVTISLSDATGTRTLLDVQGPGKGTYGLIAAFWAPDWKWIAADDGRILVVTPNEPSQTRVLTDESSQVTFGGEDPRLARFAVTDQILLEPTKN